MSAFVSLNRLRDAVIRLCDWRGQVKQQTVAHVLPLLALLEKGVNPTDFRRFEESDDFAFFDKYCRVGGTEEKPYFDPFTREFRIQSHPHSNIATARKNTFSNRWHAAETKIEDGQTLWKLSENYPEIFADRVLKKGNDVVRINVLDLAAWLLRDEEFPDQADSDDLLDAFRTRFPMSNANFDALFEYQSEPSQHIFSNVKPDDEEVAKAVTSLEIGDQPATPVVVAIKTASEKKDSSLAEDDPILTEAKALIALGTSGIILRGAPGTGKSWYADQIASSLTQGDRNRIFRVQFHPSFTYEDFFDGYVPCENSKSGFKVEGKIFRKAIECAHASSDLVVFIIDEINRGDTSRIFGETLTYIEQGWRGIPFTPRLSPAQITIPPNLLILATMNPHDRSITQLDMALLRRFDHVDIPPSQDKVGEFMIFAGMPVEQAEIVSVWFSSLQNLMPFGIGHTFFLGVSDIGRLGLIWRYRILPFCESILEFDPQRLEDIRRSYHALERRLRDTGPN